MKVLLNGKFIDDTAAVISVWDAGFLNGHGVYETFRTFNGRPKLLPEHFKRLRASAKALFIDVPYSDEQLETYILGLIEQRHTEEPAYDFKMRLTLSAGNSDIRSKSEAAPTLLITAVKRHTQKPGPLAMQSYPMPRLLPAAKSTAVLPAILGQLNAAEHNAEEALLIDKDGTVLEGAFCNVYAIKDGIMRFPDTGALLGVTQALILKLVDGLLPYKASKLTIEDFYDADEVFTTGSVRGVREVSAIDGHVIKVPGPFTIKIQQLYQDWTQE